MTLKPKIPVGRHGLSRLAIVVVGIVVLSGSLPARSTTTSVRAVGPAPAALRDAGASARRLVTLPSGDRVRITTRSDGRISATLVPAPASGAPASRTIRAGRHLYVIPRSAASTLGRTTTLSQFDVMTPAAPVIAPHFVMHTLTIRGIDAAGRPDSASGATVENVDDFRKFFSGQGFRNGLARFSVPNGHYDITGSFFRDLAGGQSEMRFVTLPQVTVSGDTTVTLDARTATSRVSAATPRPARSLQTQIMLGRVDAQGSIVTEADTVGAGTALYVSPTKPVTVGLFESAAYVRLAAADGSYIYDLEFPSDRAIAADQEYVVTPAGLATVNARYYSEVARTGSEWRDSYLPWQDFSIRSFFPLPQPAQRIEYVNGNSSVIWQQHVVARTSSDTLPIGELFDADRTYAAGERQAADWNKQPMHPGAQADLGSNAGGFFFCPVCRTGDELELAVGLWAFADNTPGHVGYVDGPSPGLTESAALVLYQDGKLVAGEPDLGIYPATPLAASYRMVLDTVRQAPYFHLSTRTHTEWTFRSAHADGTGTLPGGWYCWDGSTDCRVVPLMTARYDLPLSLSGQHAAGATRFGLSVEHLQGAPSVAVHAVQLAVSYDDGATWAPARVAALGGGRFAVAYTTPVRSATNGYVAIRLDATDATGGRLTQTVLRAYALS